MIQATHIPQVKATHFNQVLNTFYYPYTDKTSDTNLTVDFGQGLVAPLNHQHITYSVIKCLPCTIKTTLLTLGMALWHH